MSARATSALVEGGLVSLDLGPDADGLVCRVAGFGPEDVTLVPVVAPTEATQEVLPTSPPAYILVEVDGVTRALRGQVRGVDKAELVVTITDPFRLGQRRMFSRAQLVLPVRVQPLDAGGEPAGAEWRTFTRDVSAGGCRLARQSTYVAAEQHGLVVEVPRQNATVEARGTIVRESATDLGLRFLRIQEEDRLRVAQLAVDWQRGRLAGPIGAAA